uniref:C2H2-type domain-containing protein n=1 Tax=Photinus pyralis TaxID=7054 RepID=A0A1Y1N501_PHOPY
MAELKATFVCFQCKKTCSSPENLLNHLKIIHSLLNNFKCVQANCGREFCSLASFRKHINNTHFHPITNETRGAIPLQLLNLPQSSGTNPDSQSEAPVAHCNDDDKFNSDTLSDNPLINEIVALIGRLYSMSSLPRSIVQLVVESVTELMRNLSTYLKSIMEQLELTSQHVLAISNVFSDLLNVLEELGSEYLRFKYFTNLNTYIKPETFIIGEQPSLQKLRSRNDISNSTAMTFKKIEGQIIPLRKIFKLFLELPNIFQTIMSYMQKEMSLPPHLLSSVFQGQIWRNLVQKYPNDKIILPLLIYFDDFECCNPLGSKAGVYKIGATYVSLACIPPELATLLENILVCCLFYSSDRTAFGNKKIFSKLMDELIFLETQGITINFNTKKINVYFTVVTVLGDNLGLNSILGFTESFQANNFCRICKSTKAESKTQFVEDPSQIRTEENYLQDVETLSAGIKEPCIFNQLPNFSVARNTSCDIMHDILEGILRYEMAYLIDHLLTKKYFTLDNLNNRICYFNFAAVDIGNPLVEIKPEHIKKKYLIMSASQMLGFFSYFGILIADLVPEKDSCWELYTILYQIIDILLSRIISKQTIEYLEILIVEHHRLYCELFDQTLKPKHHFMIHYPTVILNLGPLRHIWSMRYEAFHKVLKSTANSVTSRKNILLTLATKQQLRLSYRFLSRQGFNDNITCGNFEDLASLKDFFILKQLLEKNQIEIDNLFHTSWLKVNSFEYKLGYASQINNDEETDLPSDLPQFGTIKYILGNKMQNIFFLIIQPLHLIGLNTHIGGYEVLDSMSTHDSINLIVMPIDRLLNHLCHNIHTMANGTKVICALQ